MASASAAEVRLVEATLHDRFLADYPPRLIGDLAYDSDPLDADLLARWAIDLIAPHRDNRARPDTQDGRPLRRYRRRWTVAMLHLVCMRILLRHI